MKRKGLIKIGILFCIITLFANTASATTRPQSETGRHGLFNIQFTCTVSWSGNQTQTPITPGEMRSINLEVASSVIRGVLGGLFLKFLKGSPYLTRISVEETPDWYNAWISEEYFTQSMFPDEVSTIHVPLYIFIDENAPNHTVGTVRIHIRIYDMRGPFEFFTAIKGCEQIATLAFVTGP